VAIHKHSDRFEHLFKRLNPSPSYEFSAASHYSSIKSLIESPIGSAASLTPKCFLQGSYKQATAIYSINDVDIVVLCRLWQPGNGSGQSFGRDEIFDIIASPLLNDHRYKEKVQYSRTSMCIKVLTTPKVEILPVVYKAENSNPAHEPFRLYRPERAQWEDGYAQYHQWHLTEKNKSSLGTFIPTIKVLKHLRKRWQLDVVSFHLECLLYNLRDSIFFGSPADYLPRVLETITELGEEAWDATTMRSPCGERDIFTQPEWSKQSWQTFHRFCSTWAGGARIAANEQNVNESVVWWQKVLGAEFFPTY